MDIGLLLLIQSIFDLFLLILVLALYRQVRRLRDLPLEETIRRLEEAHRLWGNVAQKLEDYSKEQVPDQGAPSDSGLSPKIKKEIYQLAAKGLSAPEIAEKLGLQEAEVTLLLSLKAQKKPW